MNESENNKAQRKESTDSAAKDNTTKTKVPAVKQKPAAKPKPPTGTTGKPNRLGVFLALLAIIIALSAAAGSYYLWQLQGAAEISDAQRSASISDKHTSLAANLEQTRKAFTDSRDQVNIKINRLDGQQTALQEQLATLVKRSGRLRNDWFVAEAEYLIRLANHRLLLDRDVDTALVALQAADQRLHETGDPALLPARKALANDMRKLQAVQKLDIPGLSVQLSALVSGVNKLPLATPDPDSIANSDTDAVVPAPAVNVASENEPAPGNWWDRVSGAWEVLRGLIVIRQHDQPVQPLLPPEQRYFLTQNLQLQLEQARIALLRGEAEIYAERLQQAEAWIKQFFDQSDAATQSMLESLQKLATINVAPPLPDITSGLEELTQYRGGQEETRAGATQ